MMTDAEAEMGTAGTLTTDRIEPSLQQPSQQLICLLFSSSAIQHQHSQWDEIGVIYQDYPQQRCQTQCHFDAVLTFFEQLRQMIPKKLNLGALSFSNDEIEMYSLKG